jgi:oligopeptide transport system ATP-binding protein
MMSDSEILIDVQNLKKHFPIGKGGLFQRNTKAVRAVDGISLQIMKGETLGLVGESGCGKSTAGQTILQLYEPTDGTITFKGESIIHLKGLQLRELRKRMQIIFQDPYSSLNPRMTVGDIIDEPLVIHKIYASAGERRARVRELLSIVGLNPNFANRYPHEFSGGQRQRIGIARALAVNPEFIVCDEPISALDVSIQAQIINLLRSLQQQFGLTYLFISHDLSVVRHISNRIAVMYLGKIVELADCEELYTNAFHPYTQALLSAVPTPDPFEEKKRKRIILEGDVPSPSNPPAGCHFCTRCPKVMDVCKDIDPEFRNLGNKHWVACHLYPE